MKISFLVPVVHPERAGRCIAAINESAKEYDYEILAEVDTERIGAPKMVNNLFRKSSGDVICFLGEDTEPIPGFLTPAIEALNSVNVGVVGLNDGGTTGPSRAGHFLADRCFFDVIGGRVFHEGYHHSFVDDELADIANAVNAYVYCPEAKIKHDTSGNESKENAYSYFWQDYDLYLSRKQEMFGISLAIGLPIIDKDVPIGFFLSFSAMDKPKEYRLMTPIFPPGNMAYTIASVRENLVKQAIAHRVTHLCMMDTDQTYPADTLHRLIRHKKPVVGVNVLRRYPPFDPIMMRGTLKNYIHVGDEEAFSGDIIPVDATGCGCLLFDMRTFAKLNQPYFEIPNNGTPDIVGEDIYLCHKMREAGIDIFVDTSVRVGHITNFIVTEEFRRLYVNLINQQVNQRKKGE